MAKKSKSAAQAALAQPGAEAAQATVDQYAATETTTGAGEQAAEGTGSPIKNEGKIKNIILMHLAGSTNKQIQEAGFHPTTISIQVNKYKKRAAAFIGKTDEEITKAGYTVEYVNGLDAQIKAKAEAKATAEKAAAEKLAAKPAAEAAAQPTV